MIRPAGVGHRRRSGGRPPARVARGVRPVHGLRVAATTLGLLFLWAAVAHESGSAWVQAVGAAVAALALIGLLAPALVIGSIRPEVRTAPADGESGSELRVELSCNRTCRLRPHQPGGHAGVVSRGGRTIVAFEPQRRGLLTEVIVEVMTGWPFGLLWWTRRLSLELPRPVHVRPRPGPPIPHPDLTGARDSGLRRAPASSGELRSTREYQPGDDRRSVHWPLSAHTGGLVVASRDEPASPRTAMLRVHLPADPDAAEESAGRFLGTACALLARGVPVMLVTYEHRRGLVAEPVRDPRQAGRRLAIAGTEPGLAPQ